MSLNGKKPPPPPHLSKNYKELKALAHSPLGKPLANESSFANTFQQHGHERKRHHKYQHSGDEPLFQKPKFSPSPPFHPTRRHHHQNVSHSATTFHEESRSTFY